MSGGEVYAAEEVGSSLRVGRALAEAKLTPCRAGPWLELPLWGLRQLYELEFTLTCSYGTRSLRPGFAFPGSGVWVGLSWRCWLCERLSYGMACQLAAGQLPRPALTKLKACPCSFPAYLFAPCPRRPCAASASETTSQAGHTLRRGTTQTKPCQGYRKFSLASSR